MGPIGLGAPRPLCAGLQVVDLPGAEEGCYLAFARCQQLALDLVPVVAGNQVARFDL